MTKCFSQILILLLAFTNLLSQDNTSSYKPATCYGGKTEVKRFINQEIFIPQKYIDEKIKDESILCFVVTNEGEIRELKISKSANEQLDIIALELFDKLLWLPAIFNDQAISTQECLSIKFTYSKYEKMVKRRGYDFPEYNFLPVDSSNQILPITELDTVPVPMFKNELIKVNQFISKNIKYPQMAYNNSITGTVKIYFIVEQSGRISNIRVINNLGGGCDAEALRLLQLLDWKPGYKDGKSCRTKLTFTLNFTLIEGNDINLAPSQSIGGIY